MRLTLLVVYAGEKLGTYDTPIRKYSTKRLGGGEIMGFFPPCFQFSRQNSRREKVSQKEIFSEMMPLDWINMKMEYLMESEIYF